MERITSRENKMIKEYGKLATSKSYRDKTGLFVIESGKLVGEAFNCNIPFEKVFVTQQGLEKHSAALQKLFALAGEKNAPKCYEITEDLEQKLTQTGNAQGIFGVCKKLDKPLNLNTIKKGGKYLCLSKLQDTGNVGTIIRTGDALGLNGIILSEGTCDVYSLKALRAAMGSTFRMKLFFSRNLVEDLKELNQTFTTYAAVLDPQARLLTDVTFPENSMVVIGNEGNGLEKDVVDACTEKIMIPMKGNAESFNAGMAAGLFIWEMMK